MPATVERHGLDVERGPGWLFIKLDKISSDPLEDNQLD